MGRYQTLMEKHHYLGAIPKIGETVWYLGLCEDHWVGLVSFSAAALKCAVRDQWIGWHYRYQTSRLKLLANNSRFLILPDWHYPNLGSRLLSLCLKRLSADWQAKYGHPILLVETFVDPSRFYGGIYRASNWQLLGQTQGFRRTSTGYSPQAGQRKLVFVRPLHRRAQSLLTQPQLNSTYGLGKTTMKLNAHHMRSLPDFFKEVTDPRRSQGQRHRLSTVLGIATGAVLCGMKSYEAISDWANNLSQKAREHFRCRYVKGHYIVPSLSILRDVLVRTDPTELEQAFQRWNDVYAQEDGSLAIDGKVMCNAIDTSGHQVQIMSAVGHNSGVCYAQKKSAPCRLDPMLTMSNKRTK